MDDIRHRLFGLGDHRLAFAEDGSPDLAQAFDPSIVNVGLMVFPGEQRDLRQLRLRLLSTSSFADDRRRRAPTSPLYQIVGFSSNYKRPHSDYTEHQLQSRQGAWGRRQRLLAGMQAVSSYGDLLRRGDHRRQAALVAESPNASTSSSFSATAARNASSSNVPSRTGDGTVSAKASRPPRPRRWRRRTVALYDGL